MNADAVIASAGAGRRFMEGKKKQFLLLGEKPILARALDSFEASPLIRSIHLVVAPEDMDYCLKEIVEKYGYRKIVAIRPGGKQRQDSVRHGIDSLAADSDIVVIHDGVRPFVTPTMIEASIRSAVTLGAVVLAVPVKETVKMVDPDGTVLKTLDRETLWQIQTPQAFQTSILREAFRKAAGDGFVATDDASLVERLGVAVHVLPGSYRNIKITTPEDLTLANLLLTAETSSRPEQALPTKHQGTQGTDRCE